jgi:hypothetical protein
VTLGGATSHALPGGWSTSAVAVSSSGPFARFAYVPPRRGLTHSFLLTRLAPSFLLGEISPSLLAGRQAIDWSTQSTAEKKVITRKVRIEKKKKNKRNRERRWMGKLQKKTLISLTSVSLIVVNCHVGLTRGPTYHNHG